MAGATVVHGRRLATPPGTFSPGTANSAIEYYNAIQRNLGWPHGTVVDPEVSSFSRGGLNGHFPGGERPVADGQDDRVTERRNW